MSGDRSHDVYAAPEVVEFYARQHELQPVEERLFRERLKPHMALLDIGVGAGRTTPYLARAVSSYVGADYSETMVAHCRRSFPALRFETADATHMPGFATASFDAVVFSFNGIDSIPTRAGRLACLREIARVLRPGGVFVYSAHNARYLYYRPVTTAGLGRLKSLWRHAYAAMHSAWLVATRLSARAFWRGSGHVRDPGTHGGLRIYVTLPEHERVDLAACGLRLETILAGPRPEETWAAATPWFYYACVREPVP